MMAIVGNNNGDGDRDDGDGDCDWNAIVIVVWLYDSDRYLSGQLYCHLLSMLWMMSVTRW